MIGTILGIIFNREKGQFGLVFAMTDPFKDHPEGIVITGDGGLRRGFAGTRPASVIFRKTHHNEIGQTLRRVRVVIVFLKLVKLVDEGRGIVVIARPPPKIFGGNVTL